MPTTNKFLNQDLKSDLSEGFNLLYHGGFKNFWDHVLLLVKQKPRKVKRVSQG